jgi:tetratricopeptide (TPR) repeat protein
LPGRLAVVACALWLSLLPGRAAGAGLTLDDDALWGYAEQLRQQGEYYRAVSEYKRLLHFFPASPHAGRARVSLGLALLQGSEPAQALEALEPAALGRLPDTLTGDGYFLRGVAWLELDPTRPYAMREPELAQALGEFETLPPDWPLRERTAGFVRAMREPPQLPSKSPMLAGSLSAVLPGAGSFYVGRYAEGSRAFFLTALLGYATVTSFDQDHVAAGTVFGALTLAFYGGAIYSAANGAHKYNNAVRETFLGEQRRRFGIAVGAGRVAGAFNLQF